MCIPVSYARRAQPREATQTTETDVGHPRVAEVEFFEVLEPAEVYKAG